MITLTCEQDKKSTFLWCGKLLESVRNRLLKPDDIRLIWPFSDSEVCLVYAGDYKRRRENEWYRKVVNPLNGQTVKMYGPIIAFRMHGNGFLDDLTVLQQDECRKCFKYAYIDVDGKTFRKNTESKNGRVTPCKGGDAEQ